MDHRVVEVLGDTFLAAELGDAVRAAQAFKNDADLLLGREVPPGGSPDIPDGLLRTLRSLLVSLSHRVPPRGYDEPKILSYAISSICPAGPDGEHGRPLRFELTDQTRLAIDEYLLNVTGVSEFAVQSHPVPLQLMPAALALPEMLP